MTIDQQKEKHNPREQFSITSGFELDPHVNAGGIGGMAKGEPKIRWSAGCGVSGCIFRQFRHPLFERELGA